MPQVQVAINNRTGLHARPAAVFVAEAQKHPCRIVVQHQGRSADAKSILSVLALGVHGGQTITIIAEGHGAEEALRRLVQLVNSGLEVC